MGHWSIVKQAIAEVTSVDEIKPIRDKVGAARAYAKQAGESLEMQNGSTEVKIRAERRAGELLSDMDKNKGAATPYHDGSAPRLSELGNTHNQSSRWQSIATLPQEEFDT